MYRKMTDLECTAFASNIINILVHGNHPQATAAHRDFLLNVIPMCMMDSWKTHATWRDNITDAYNVEKINKILIGIQDLINVESIFTSGTVIVTVCIVTMNNAMALDKMLTEWIGALSAFHKTRADIISNYVKTQITTLKNLENSKDDWA